MPRTQTCDDLIVTLSNVLAAIQHGAPEGGNGRAESVEMSFAHKAIREARFWILEHRDKNGDAAATPPPDTLDEFLKKNKATPVMRVVEFSDDEHTSVDFVAVLTGLGYRIEEVELESEDDIPEGFVLVQREG